MTLDEQWDRTFDRVADDTADEAVTQFLNACFVEAGVENLVVYFRDYLGAELYDGLPAIPYYKWDQDLTPEEKDLKMTGEMIEDTLDDLVGKLMNHPDIQRAFALTVVEKVLAKLSARKEINLNC
jgi:hypothetical protein